MRSGLVSKRLGKLYVLQGLSQCGKSSYANQWLINHYNAVIFNKCLYNNPVVVLSGDDFRKALTGLEFVPQAEGMVFSTLDIAAKALLLRGFDVIVDETNTTEASVLRMLRIDINAEFILIDTPVEICIQRAIENNRPYLVGPIKRMDKQLKALRANWDETIKRLKNYLNERKEHDVTV